MYKEITNKSFLPITCRKNLYMSKENFLEFLKNLNFAYVGEYNIKLINNFIYNAKDNTVTEQGYTIIKNISGDDLNALDK